MTDSMIMTPDMNLTILPHLPLLAPLDFDTLYTIPPSMYRHYTLFSVKLEFSLDSKYEKINT